MEDFIPWVTVISSTPPPPPPPASEEEEEEDKMADLVHNFSAQKLKMGANFKRVTDATPRAIGEVDQHPTGEGSDGSAIVVVDSPEMGFHAHSAFETRPSVDLGDVSLTHEEVREGIPLGQITSRPDKATSSRSKRSRPLLPD